MLACGLTGLCQVEDVALQPSGFLLWRMAFAAHGAVFSGSSGTSRGILHDAAVCADPAAAAAAVAAAAVASSAVVAAAAAASAVGARTFVC
eukprot:365603-Chlamydomonas_euryale.AAC.17